MHKQTTEVLLWHLIFINHHECMLRPNLSHQLVPINILFWDEWDV